MSRAKPIDRHFIDRLNVAIGESNMSLSDIERKSGIKTEMLWHWTHGVLPSTGALKDFCKATNVSADWMLGLSDRKELIRHGEK